jgi:hypothetical protein
MSDGRECVIAYFISLTHCQREDAIKILEKNKWELDLSLNLFFENDYKQNRESIRSKSIDAPYQQYEKRTSARPFDLVPLLPRSSSSSKTIVMPALIEFNR